MVYRVEYLALSLNSSILALCPPFIILKPCEFHHTLEVVVVLSGKEKGLCSHLECLRVERRWQADESQ